jgi:hypothetical protein
LDEELFAEDTGEDKLLADEPVEPSETAEISETEETFETGEESELLDELLTEDSLLDELLHSWEEEDEELLGMSFS